MTTTKYCYSTDEELFNFEDMGDVIDHLQDQTDDSIIGATYWRGESVELTLGECIDVDSFLEVCDERAYDEIGEIYDNCFSDVTDEERKELRGLIEEWANRCVKMRYWKVINSKEMKITAEDLE